MKEITRDTLFRVFSKITIGWKISRKIQTTDRDFTSAFFHNDTSSSALFLHNDTGFAQVVEIVFCKEKKTWQWSLEKIWGRWGFVTRPKIPWSFKPGDEYLMRIFHFLFFIFYFKKIFFSFQFYWKKMKILNLKFFYFLFLFWLAAFFCGGTVYVLVTWRAF